MEIEKGDVVRIIAQGTVRTVTVQTATNYGTTTDPCWYIEGNDKSHGAVYWKQDADGGAVEIMIESRAGSFFGTTEDAIEAFYQDQLKRYGTSRIMHAFNMLSDAQELIHLDQKEKARKTINRAKYHLDKAADEGHSLALAAAAAEDELDRLTGDIGFEPERFRERLRANHDLHRALRPFAKTRRFETDRQAEDA